MSDLENEQNEDTILKLGLRGRRLRIYLFAAGPGILDAA